MALYTEFTIDYLVPQLGQIRLLELRAQRLDRMCASITMGRRGRPLSPITIRRIYGVLRSALNTAVKRRLIPYNPAEHIQLAPETPRGPSRGPRSSASRFCSTSRQNGSRTSTT